MKKSKEYNVQELFHNLLLSNPKSLNDNLEKALDIIVDHSEKQKGVLAVIITGMVYKHYHLEQDVRKHQANMPGGYSGRSFDTKWITPFLKANEFPAMSESGWLTRSLEQAMPYDKNYLGKISGIGLKKSFLDIYEAIEAHNNVDTILARLFQKLVSKREHSNLKLYSPKNLTINQAFKLIKNHIEYKYKNLHGTSRLPSLAIYSAYESIISSNIGRYKGKILIPIESHTTTDKSTGLIGDIQINDENNQPFEGIEIKAKKITSDMIEMVYKKIHEYSTVSRYFILTTFDSQLEKDKALLDKQVAKVRIMHGCDIITNGVYTTLKYFLRLIDTDLFIKNYIKYLSKDNSIKYEHKIVWNELCSSLV